MNKSGIEPMKYQVLVMPDKVEEKTGGGIILPSETKEKEEFARTRGTIIAVGSIAFTDPDWLRCPRVGEKVIFDRYAGGMPVKGTDGEYYRLINDEEIRGIAHE